VQKASFGNYFKAIDNVSKDWDSLLFREFFSFFEQVLEITLIAKLGYYIAVIDSTIDVVAFQDIYMVKFFQRIDFSLEHLSSRFILDGFEINDLDGNLIFCSFVDSAKYARAKPFSD